MPNARAYARLVGVSLVNHKPGLEPGHTDIDRAPPLERSSGWCPVSPLSLRAGATRLHHVVRLHATLARRIGAAIAANGCPIIIMPTVAQTRLAGRAITVLRRVT